MNLAHVKKQDQNSALPPRHKKDLSLDVNKSNASFYTRRPIAEIPSVLPGTRVQTEAEDSSRKIPAMHRKTNSSKTYIRAKTEATPTNVDVLANNKGQEIKFVPHEDHEINEIPEDTKELIKSNLVLKEIIKRVCGKYRVEKVFVYVILNRGEIKSCRIC